MRVWKQVNLIRNMTIWYYSNLFNYLVLDIKKGEYGLWGLSKKILTECSMLAWVGWWDLR